MIFYRFLISGTRTGIKAMINVNANVKHGILKQS